jgi:hypothetical protein
VLLLLDLQATEAVVRHFGAPEQLEVQEQQHQSQGLRESTLIMTQKPAREPPPWTRQL